MHHYLGMVKQHPTEPIAARATVTKQKETPVIGLESKYLFRWQDESATPLLFFQHCYVLPRGFRVGVQSKSWPARSCITNIAVFLLVVIAKYLRRVCSLERKVKLRSSSTKVWLSERIFVQISAVCEGLFEKRRMYVIVKLAIMNLTYYDIVCVFTSLKLN